MLQLLVVTSQDWNAVEGNLYRFERNSPQSEWIQVADSIPVTVGQKGMAWGLGEHAVIQEAPSKQEGDLKSPAGIFFLGTAFGDFDHLKYALNFPYLVIEDDTECVDDPSSKFYNQFVNADTNPKDWASSEKMLEVGYLYNIGIEVKHNSQPVIPNRGSCIFIHIWRDDVTGTGGCTAMEEENLNEILSWLNAEKQPALVQLPLQEYREKQRMWNLPNLPGKLVADGSSRNP